MADQEYQFDRQSVERIAKTVRRLEATLRPDGRGVSTGGPQGGQRVALVLITSVTQNANGYYPGRQYVAPQASIQDPQAPQTSNSSPPGYGTVGNYGNYGQASQGNDCWIAWQSGILPQNNQIIPGISAATHTDGLPIYYVGGSYPTAWQTDFADPTTVALSGTYAAGSSLSTPGFVGDIYEFAVTFRWQFQTSAAPLLADVGLKAKITDAANAGNVLVAEWTPFHKEITQTGANDFLEGTSTMTFQATATAAGLAPQINGILVGSATRYNLVVCQFGPAWWTAKRLSIGPIPTASSVNGQTGGINLTGGGSIPVVGGSANAGAGVAVSTAGNTITTGLTAAALAALNSYLARNNL